MNKELTKCPLCKSKNIFAEHFESDTEEAWREVKCSDCQHVWTEVYKFSHIEKEMCDEEK